ncbi:MAG: hypothetical protein COZ18_17040 [Flexibacter sp. CG_4_10_14_3_um_filter_32_15]|nr:MAG: hypothetical protein COZ18_17040 [Flexibacter sp. CG_4_10_14_3_um_filter_32_15]
MLYQNERKTFLIEEVILTDPHVSDNQETKIKKALRLYLIGRLTVEEHREGFETYFEMFRDGNYTHAIFDYLKLEYDPPQSRAWFVTSYVPRYGRELKERECYVAVIEPSNMFQKMTTSLIGGSIQKIYNNLHISYFSDIEKGQNWLLKQ